MTQIKFVLCISLILMSLSCYIFFLEGENCFVAFELTDSIRTDLDGNALNLVKPLGWVGMGMFTASCILFRIYYINTARIMRDLKEGKLEHKNREFSEVAAAHLNHQSLSKSRRASSPKMAATRNVRSII
jgi:hypothetical protein